MVVSIKQYWLFILTFILSSRALCAGLNPFAEINQLCPSVRMLYDYDLAFTSTERNLLCGSRNIDAWRDIPLQQAKAFMASFLEARGYHHPDFRIEADTLYVKPGVMTLVRSLTSRPESPDLDLESYWEPLGRPLTPETLDSIEKWVSQKLSQIGYPCAEVQTQGDPESGTVSVVIERGPLWVFDRVEEDPIPFVRGGMLERYRAFQIGQTYDARLAELSAQRLIGSQVVINSHFIPDCKATKPGLLRHEILPGAPRLVSFGLGFDTENLFIMRGAWRNSRLTDTASLLDVSSTLTYRQQNVLTVFDWYYLPIPSRHYLKTSLKFERLYERRFETRTIRSVLAPAWRYDPQGYRLDIFLGPSLQSEMTQRGEGPRTARLVSLDFGLGVESHLFEYYANSPKTGFRFRIDASRTSKEVFSDLSASKIALDFTYLWNVLDLDPEIWILGTRGQFASSRPEGETQADDLPSSFRYFLGGSQDMRGFARQSLPSNAAGALSKAYWGHELRLNHVLPYQIQPLLFADWGWLGDKPEKLLPTQYFSPGFGARWESPFGTMRGSFAHGKVSGPDSETLRYLETWQFYFSFGEQF